MNRRGASKRRQDRAPDMIPCGGKGWRAGECEFCRRKRAEYCPLRNVPREFEFESGISALLRVGGGRRLRQAMKLRPKG